MNDELLIPDRGGIVLPDGSKAQPTKPWDKIAMGLAMAAEKIMKLMEHEEKNVYIVETDYVVVHIARKTPDTPEPEPKEEPI